MQLVSVVELPGFQRRAKGLLSDAELTALVDFVATNPDSGVQLGGGLRKVRFARPGSGKSGGYRIIHYHVAETGGPVFLPTLFAKNEKASLTSAETVSLAKLGEEIAARYRSKTSATHFAVSNRG